MIKCNSDLRKPLMDVVGLCLENGAKKAIKYVEPGLVVTCARQHKRDKREKSESFVLTIGKPNYAARKAIKQLLAAGEPFPVKRTKVQWYENDGPSWV